MQRPCLQLVISGRQLSNCPSALPCPSPSATDHPLPPLLLTPTPFPRSLHRFLDTERGMDLLRVTAPAPGPLPPGAPEQLPLASYSGATTDPWVAAHNPLTILTHHTFTVSFVSDFATQGRGFLMTYTVRPRPATWPPSPPPPPPPPPRPPPPVLCVPRLVVHDGQRVTSLEGSYVTDDLSLRLEQARNPVDAGAARVDPAAPAPAGVQPLPALPEGHPSTWLAHLYGPNAECSWVVRAPPDALIRVELR